ncbi:MAG: hypothetical protein IT233_12540 [Bacteroidia bacterium]|nr:hypothetical protein [Bacteroidia bacterium]
MSEQDCKRCGGFGQISESEPSINPGELPPPTVTCPDCNGKGYLPLRFFVEFIFDYDLLGRTYWLPLFILSDSVEQAKVITASTKLALEENYKNVQHRVPVPEIEMTRPYIQSKIDLNKRHRLAKLEINVWKFIDIAPNPNWSFDEHLKFIAEENPLNERLIASCVEAKKFPVRIIKDNLRLVDIEEFLLVNVVRS